MKKLIAPALFAVALLEGAFIVKKHIDNKLSRENVYKQYYLLLNKWHTKRNHGFMISEELKRRDFSNIGVYGMGSIASAFIDEIADSGINVVFIADKDASDFYEGSTPLILPEEISNYYSEIDAIIITPIGWYDDIFKKLKKLGFSDKAVSISELVYNEQES